MKSWIRAGLVLATAAGLACGGDDLVLPEEGVPADITIIGGNNQTATVGAELPEPLAVRVVDGEGRAVQGAAVSFTVVAGGGSVSPGSGSTNANGEVSTTWTVGTGAGAQQVLAKVTGSGVPDDLEVLFTANAGASNATTLEMVSGDDQTATAGSALPDSLVVRALDASDNPVAGVTVTWTITGGGAVGEASTTTGADGRAAVRRTLGATAGEQTTTATAAGLDGSPIVFSATATVGAAGRLTIDRQPSSTASSGGQFAQQPRVQLEDNNGNDVASPGIAVTAQIASGPGGAALVGTATVSTNANGLASFLNLGIAGPAGTYTLNFVVLNRTDISGSPPTTGITLAAGAPARLSFERQPTSTTAGATISPSVQVRIEDALGNLVGGATNAVTVSLGNNPGGGTLSGTRTVNASGGVATFSTLSIDRPGNGYSIVASASGLTGATSNPFNITTGAATTIAANSATSLSGVAGSAVSPAPSVKVTDGSGNGVAGVSVTFAVTAGGGSVSGASQTTNSLGVATVGSWILGTAAGTNNNQLRATSSGLSGSPVTFTASATAGSAGVLDFITQPASTGQSGVALSPQPVLQLEDALGNPVSTGGVTVTATIASGPSGTLSGNSVNTTSNGRATFTNLVINGPSGTYTLAFSGPDLTGVTSEDIVIGSGAAARLDITTQPSTSVENGVDFPQQPVIQLEDASGNAVGQANVTISVTTQSCAGRTLGGDLSAETNSQGVATFTNLRLTGTTGTCRLLFAATGLTSVASDLITVGPGPVSAAQSTITASPGSITAGGSGSTITVTVRDQSNNVVPGVDVLPSVQGTGSFAPSGTQQTNGSGVATFTFTSTDAGTQTIRASADGVLITDDADVVVAAGAADPSTSTLDVSPGSIVAGGSGATATVTARDQFGNVVSGAAVVVDVTGSATIAPSASGSTSGSGVFTATITSTTAGARTVSATVDGASLPTAPLTITAAAPAAGESSVAVTPTSVETGVQVTVDVLTADQYGNPAGGTVSLESSLAGTFGTTSPAVNAAGQASTTFTPSEAGTHTITATLTNAQGSIQETTTLEVTAPPVSGSTSTLGLAPGNITAGGNTTVTVTARDASSAVVPGASILLAVTGGGVTIGPENPQVADGSGVAVFTVGSTSAGNKTVSAAANGIGISQTGQLAIAAGAPDAGQSSLAVDPSSTTAGSAVDVTATFADAFGNAIAGGSVTLGTSNSGSFADPTLVTSGAGVAVTTYTPTATGPHTLSADLDGLVEDAALTVGAGAVSGTASALVVQEPTTFEAGLGTTVLVTARDAEGNPVEGASIALSLTGSGNTILETPLLADAAGEATFEVFSEGAGSKTVTAVADGVPILQDGTVVVTAAAPDVVQSSLEATPGVVDVGQPSTLQLLVRDTYGNPVPGLELTLASSLAGAFGASPVTTDLTGSASTSYTPAEAGAHELTATAGAFELAAAVTATVLVESTDNLNR